LVIGNLLWFAVVKAAGGKGSSGLFVALAVALLALAPAKRRMLSEDLAHLLDLAPLMVKIVGDGAP
jgi:hypothetical protein